MRFKGFNIPRPSFSFRVTWGEGKWRIKLSPYTYEHPRPSVTVDLVIFSSRPEGVNILLIQRGREPFKPVNRPNNLRLAHPLHHHRKANPIEIDRIKPYHLQTGAAG
jgi:hypothetical protein